MNKILVIGSINLDYVISIKDMPKLGETIKCKNFEMKYGGKGCNQAFYSSILNSKVTFLSKIHNDEESNKIIDFLKKNKVNTNYIKYSKNQTGKAIIMLDENSENSIIVIPGSNEDIDIKYIEDNLKLIEENDYILLQNEIPYATISYILKIANKMNKYVAYNLAPASNINKEDYKYINCLILNESEYSYLKNECLNFKEKNDNETIDELFNLGVKSLIITLGDKGSKYIDRNNNIWVMAQKTIPVDTTGAGDSFIGAYFSKFNGNNFRESLEFASNIAKEVIKYKGAQILIGGKINEEN